MKLPNRFMGEQTVRARSLVFVGIAVLLLGVVATWRLTQYKTSVDICTERYTQQCAVDEANLMLKAEKQEELKKVVDKIVRQGEFENDPTLLNILATYYVNSGDIDNADKTVSKLSSAYNANPNYNATYNTHYSVQELKDQIAGLKSSQQQVQNNTTTFGNPE